MQEINKNSNYKIYLNVDEECDDLSKLPIFAKSFEIRSVVSVSSSTDMPLTSSTSGSTDSSDLTD